MKHLPFFVIFLVALITITFKATAQSDYVITVKGDSIPCKISRSFIGIMKYKSATMTESESIEPDVIKEYYVAKKNILHRAVFKEGSNSPMYMTVIEKGKISLFEEIVVSSSIATYGFGAPTTTRTSVEEWYISKGSDNVSKIKTTDIVLLINSKQKRKDAFGDMLKDNKAVYEKYLNDDKFTFKQIQNLVHLYNTGVSLGKQDYVIKKNKDTIFCEIELGSYGTMNRYRADPNGRFMKIDTAITGFFLASDSSSYVLKIIPIDKHPLYVKSLSMGKINLYAYKSDSYEKDSDASLFAVKDSGVMIQIRHIFGRSEKNDKKIFADLISDNPALAEKYKDSPYTVSSILSCIKTYNSENIANHKSSK